MIIGRAIAAYNSIRDAPAHMVKQCGLTDAAVVETPVTAADGDNTIADVVYFDSLSPHFHPPSFCRPLGRWAR